MRFAVTALVLLFAGLAHAQTPPQGWTCDPGFFGDGSCDCGCGVQDSDCANAELATCEFNSCPDPAGSGTVVPVRTNPTQCTTNACGDAVLADAEECDDGNTTPGDGCSATCTTEPGFDCNTDRLTSTCGTVVCSDGVVSGAEECDDGNATAGDGCSATCTVEAGFSCPTAGQPCTAVPSGFTCDPLFYGDGFCDCGCGVDDLAADCPNGATADACFDDCPDGQHLDPNDTTSCVAGTGEGEGEGDVGEGEGSAGEGEAGEGEGEGGIGRHDGGEGEGEGDAPQCAGSPVTSTTAPASLLALVGLAALFRKRRR